MAGVSSRVIKNRIRSLRSTRQITKAMEIVAASKLRIAQTHMLSTRPYFEALYDTVHEIADSARDLSSPYLTARTGTKSAWIVIAGDRGLAGGYNANVLRLAWNEMEGSNAVVIPIGQKALSFFSDKCQIMTDAYAKAEEITVGDCYTIGKFLCMQYLNGELDSLQIVYTNFVSALSQAPVKLPILPLLRANRHQKAPIRNIHWEPDIHSVFDAMIPEYVAGLLYGAFYESRASEEAARRTAMEAATKNAKEMIDTLSLQYNRTRQAAITQEITEIVAGS